MSLQLCIGARASMIYLHLSIYPSMHVHVHACPSTAMHRICAPGVGDNGSTGNAPNQLATEDAYEVVVVDVLLSTRDTCTAAVQKQFSTERFVFWQAFALL